MTSSLKVYWNANLGQYVMLSDSKRDAESIKKDIRRDYVSELVTIFDQMLANAADNSQRDPRTDIIKVKIDRQRGFFSVSYDGQSISIDTVLGHNGRKYWIPEMVFGYFQIPGLQNFPHTVLNEVMRSCGLGAKFMSMIVSNAFSSKFVIDIDYNDIDSHKGTRRYHQEFLGNWRHCLPPDIIRMGRTIASSTTITFYPDFSLFGMTHLDNDTVEALSQSAKTLSSDCKVSLKVN
jgi:DNA topoisomerase-2